MDRTSSYMTGKRIKEMNLDGAKLLWRWVPAGEKNDRYALETLERIAKATSVRGDQVQRARALLAVSAGQSWTAAARINSKVLRTNRQCSRSRS